MKTFRRVAFGAALLFLVCAASGADERRAGPPFTRLDSLFLTAATGEPRFQAARDSAFDALVAGEEETLEYLIARRLRGQTPRQRHTVERLFTAIADSGRNPASRLVLARALSGSLSDSDRAFLLYTGSRLGDSAFLPEARAHLRWESERVRRMAVRGLGAYPHRENVPLLLAGLPAREGLELHQRLWALDAHGPVKNWEFLLPLLEDARQFNRRKARDLLLRATDSSWAALREKMPADASGALRREWRLLALDAKGGRAFLEGEKAAMTEEERVFFGL